MILKILVLSGSNVGHKTEVAAKAILDILAKDQYSDHQVQFINLLDKEMDFADGRNFLDYKGDTLEVAQAVMEADVLFIGTSLKNVFDLLPEKALEYKTVGIFASSGSNRHYLIPELQLKPILNYMKANVTPRYVYLSARDFTLNEISSDDVLLRLEQLVDETLTLAKTYQEIQRIEDEKLGF